MWRVARMACAAAVMSGIFAAPGTAQPVGIAQMFVNPSNHQIDLMLAAPPNVDLTGRLQAAPVSRGWQVLSLEIATGATRAIDVTDVTVDQKLSRVRLQLATVDREWLDTSTHTVSVTFLRSSNLARAVSVPMPAEPGSVATGVFRAAPTVQAADVYFSGKITAAGGSKPKYSFEAKLTNDWGLGGNKGNLGYVAEVAADEAANADPDRIAAGVKYRRVINPTARGLILQVQPISGEFGRKAPRTTTLLATAHVEHVLVPTTGSAKSVARWAVVVFGGIETGNNFANAIDKENGSGSVFRVRAAANPYVVFKPGKRLLKSVKSSAMWEGRFLGAAEIDPGELDAGGQPTETRRARHYLKADFDFGVTELVALTIQHRWGYLPPTYKKVNPSVTLSLTFKGQWF